MPKNSVRRNGSTSEENMGINHFKTTKYLYQLLSIRGKSEFLFPDTDQPASPRLPQQTRSQSPPTMPPRAKTVYAGVTHPVIGNSTSSSVHGNMRKRNNPDPYANFDRLQKAKSIVEKAIRVRT